MYIHCYLRCLNAECQKGNQELLPLLKGQARVLCTLPLDELKDLNTSLNIKTFFLDLEGWTGYYPALHTIIRDEKRSDFVDLINFISDDAFLNTMERVSDQALHYGQFEKVLIDFPKWKPIQMTYRSTGMDFISLVKNVIVNSAVALDTIRKHPTNLNEHNHLDELTLRGITKLTSEQISRIASSKKLILLDCAPTLLKSVKITQIEVLIMRGYVEVNHLSLERTVKEINLSGMLVNEMDRILFSKSLPYLTTLSLQFSSVAEKPHRLLHLDKLKALNVLSVSNLKPRVLCTRTRMSSLELLHLEIVENSATLDILQSFEGKTQIIDYYGKGPLIGYNTNKNTKINYLI